MGGYRIGIEAAWDGSPRTDLLEGTVGVGMGAILGGFRTLETVKGIYRSGIPYVCAMTAFSQKQGVSLKFLKTSRHILLHILL